MLFFKRLFSKAIVREQTDSIGGYLGEFARLNVNERMRQVILNGDSGNKENYDLMKYCILNDDDINVKMAALKRIHLFKENPDLTEVLLSVKGKIDVTELEPYYSMALHRIGAISMKEFEKRISAG